MTKAKNKTERPYKDRQMIRDVYQRRAVARLYGRYCTLRELDANEGVTWSESAHGWVGGGAFLGTTVADVLAGLYLFVEKMERKQKTPRS